MAGEFFVINLVELDPDPTLDSDVGWSKELPGSGKDEGLLVAGSSGYPYGNMPVVVMVVSEHGEDFLGDEKGRLTMRELLQGAGKVGADPADPAEMFFGFQA